MKKDKPADIFMPPNLLKAKLGGTIGGLDMAALKRAEKAMTDMKAEFSDWMAKDVDRLVQCRDKYAAAPCADSAGDLYRAGHDLKGQAQTFDYPFAGRIASSLCKLMDGLGEMHLVPLSLVDAHVNAIRIVVRDKIMKDADNTALALAEELEKQVGEILAATK